MNLTIKPINGIPLIKSGDNIADIICNSLKNFNSFFLEDEDIVVICHTIISKAKHYIKNINTIKPTRIAKTLSNSDSIYGKLCQNIDEKLVQLILDNSNEIIRARPFLITESKQGFICAHSGTDKSNIPGENNYGYLPIDGDKEAELIREEIKKITQKDIVVILTDSHGRPFRIGTIGIAVGISGMDPLIDYRGKKDLYDFTLKEKIVNIADELCSAAQIVMGEADEGIPAALIKGFDFEKYNSILNKKTHNKYSITKSLRPKEKDMFRIPDPLDFIRGQRNFKGEFLPKKIDEIIIKTCMDNLRLIIFPKCSISWDIAWIKTKDVKKSIFQVFFSKYKEIDTNQTRGQENIFFLPECFVFSLNHDDQRNIISLTSVCLNFIYQLKYFGIESHWKYIDKNDRTIFSNIIYNFNPNLNPNFNPNHKPNSPIFIIISGYVDHKIGEILFPHKESLDNIYNYFREI